jgi:hypothetical protein
MHYQLPVYPFLALGVADAVVRFTGRRSIERTAWTLVALSLVAGPLYFGVLLPHLRPGEDPDIAAARRIVAETIPTQRIIAVGEMAETIAFVGRRANVLEQTIGEEIVDSLNASASGALIVVDRSEQGILDPVRARMGLDEVRRIEGDHRTWLVYRVPSAGLPLGRGSP